MEELMQALRCHFISTILLLSLLGTAVVASGAEGRDSNSVAIIKDWEWNIGDSAVVNGLCIDDDYNPIKPSDTILHEERQCNSRDFDDAGNMYIAFYDSNSGNLAIGVNYLAGINVVKLHSSGQIEDVINVQISGSGVGVQSIVVVSEDVFYLSIYGREGRTITFDNSLELQINGSSYREVIGYHSTSGWQWAIEAGPGSRPDNSDIEIGNYHWDVASDGGLVSLEWYDDGSTECDYPGDTDPGLTYRLNKYDIIDGSIDWTRSLDSCIAVPHSHEVSPHALFIDGDSIYLYAESSVKITLQGVSQDCDGHMVWWLSMPACQTFARYSNQGQLTWSKTVPYTGVHFTKFNPVSDGILMAGWWSWMGQNYTNYSGQITMSDEVGVSIAKLDFGGNWDYHHTWGMGADADEDIAIQYPIVSWDDDDDFVIALPFWGGTLVLDSSHSITTSSEISTAIFAFSSSGQYQWSSYVVGNGITLPLGFAISNNRAMILSAGQLSFGSTFAVSDSSFALGWIDTDDGVWGDYHVYLGTEWGEQISAVVGVNSEGTFLTFHLDESNYTLESWIEDTDGDDIAPSLDNCDEVWNPDQSDLDSDGEGDACDDDDDNDSIIDLLDLCPRGEIGWISTGVLDHDGDGCLDQNEEDRDDDNDGLSDQMDLCPVGVIGLGNDRDGDGCKDSEDSDDDNDGIHDGSDYCPSGSTNWLSGDVTDYDSDGCEDSGEDYDDDGDGVYDVFDDCPKGELGWSSNTNTDFDGDGCRDGVEDEDDDNDGVQNPSDECPNSVGTVDSRGCTVEQGMGGNSGGGGNSTTVIYYVCPGGTAVVLDLSDCPLDIPEQTDESENESSSVTVDDNGTISADSIPTGLYLCPDRTALVTDPADCPIAASSGPDSGTSSDEEASMDTAMILVAGVLVFGTILLISLLIVSIVRVREMKAMRESGMYTANSVAESQFEF